MNYPTTPKPDLPLHSAARNAPQTPWRIGLPIRCLGRVVQWDPRRHTMSLRRDPGVAPIEFPSDDVTLPVVWERERGRLARAS